MLAIALLLLASRLCHSGVVWVEEAYPLAGALQILDGQVPHRHFWYDKPPLLPLFYLLCGARTGLALRLLDTAFCLASCWFAYRAGLRLFTPRAGQYAAALLAFFLVFDHHSVVIAIAPDLFLLLPTFAAVAFTLEGRPLAAGFTCALAIAANLKGVFLVPVCVLFAPPAAGRILVGCTPAALLLLIPGFREQVIDWGRVYSGDTFLADPLRTALTRTLAWAGFHSALLCAAWRLRDRRFYLWFVLALASVTLGWRFFPRYYFALLPPLVLAAAHGLENLCRPQRYLLPVLLLIPLVRFGPRYAQLALGQPWPDLALYEDARQAAAHVDGPVFVWGYRPEINVLARQPSRDFYLESQPLTGVFADRHLFSTRRSAPPRPLPQGLTSPYVVDGLGLLNPALALPPALRQNYTEIARTRSTIIYRAVSPSR